MLQSLVFHQSSQTTWFKTCLSFHLNIIVGDFNLEFSWSTFIAGNTSNPKRTFLSTGLKRSPTRLPLTVLWLWVSHPCYFNLNYCIGSFNSFSRKNFSEGGFTNPPVANAIKRLQACIYKSLNTGLFKKAFVAASVDKINIIMLFSSSTLYLKVKKDMNLFNLTRLVATNNFNSSPVITVL